MKKHSQKQTSATEENRSIDQTTAETDSTDQAAGGQVTDGGTGQEQGDRDRMSADELRVGQLEEELERERYKHRFYRALLSTVCTLIVVAAVAILIANLWMPVLRVSGDSMAPTLIQDDVLVAFKTDSFEAGDLVAFYYNNKILVKRVIATSGEWVDIADDGTVYVDEIRLDEPYIEEPARGDCNIDLPYQVPESRIFVMGDHRSVSLDSRSTSVGCVANEQIVGKIIFRIWPFNSFGAVN